MIGWQCVRGFIFRTARQFSSFRSLDTLTACSDCAGSILSEKFCSERQGLGRIGLDFGSCVGLAVSVSLSLNPRLEALNPKPQIEAFKHSA